MKQFYRYIILLLAVLTLSSGRLCAQMDILSVETGIAGHKNIRSVLLARETVEQANLLLHDKCRDANVEYRDINVKLDKYTRCFDIIDLLYNSAQLVFNCYNTGEHVARKIQLTRDLMVRYKERVLERQYRQLKHIGGTFASIADINSVRSAEDWFDEINGLYNNGVFVISAQDTIIFKIAEGVIKAVLSESEDMLTSLYDLALYTTGIPGGGSQKLASCSTEKLLEIVNSINENLNHIRRIIDDGYYALWKYIHVRTSSWWSPVLTPRHTIREICDNAISRWRYAQLKPLNK